MAPEEGTPDYDEQVESMVRTVQAAGVTQEELGKTMSLYLKDPDISRKAIAAATRILRGQ